jgi:diguanylate cyclase (GGDEF)-like protein
MLQKKILLIDDSEFFSQYIGNILTEADYQFIRAASGKEGLKLVSTEKPDLVILDVVMPDLSGLEVCRILREAEGNNLMPIIMLTSQGNEADKLVGLELGADDYITKPFNKRELLSRVRNTLRRIDRNRSANPLTGLQGNIEIQAELISKIEGNKPFAVIYADIDNFKAFNDAYGFAKGDSAIKMTADILSDQIRYSGSPGDFLGHIGGDDFVMIVNPDNTDLICDGIISQFDRRICSLYNEEDLRSGRIVTSDRRGDRMEFPIMTISLAVVSSENRPFKSHVEIAKIAAELKKKAKMIQGSVYLKNCGAADE